jgi:hypothetical protein
MSATPYIGSRINLISKAEIRYEGKLYSVDLSESTVTLANGIIKLKFRFDKTTCLCSNRLNPSALINLLFVLSQFFHSTLVRYRGPL